MELPSPTWIRQELVYKEVSRKNRSSMNAKQEKLINDHYGLIGFVLQKYFKNWYPKMPGLVSQGHWILMRCSDPANFDPSKAKFSTYFVRSYRLALYRYISQLVRDRTRFRFHDPHVFERHDVLRNVDFVHRSEDTLTLVLHRDKLRLLQKAINGLSEPHRTDVRLRYIKQLTLREIGVIQKVSKEAIRQRLVTAMRKLKPLCLAQGLKPASFQEEVEKQGV